ncbi:MAG: DMT family transporter [Hyphomicrobiaceae bacterium]
MSDRKTQGLTTAVALAALGAVVIWGASPVATKIAVEGLPAIVVAALRTVLGGLLALPVALLLRTPLPRGRAETSLLGLSAFSGFVAFPLLYSIGIGLTSANHASLILAVLPVYTGAIAMAIERRWPKALWWAGCLVALGGEALLISSRAGATSDGSSLQGDAIVLGSAVFASAGYVAGGRLKQIGYPSTGATFWGAAAMALLVAPALPFIAAGIDWTALPVEGVLSVGYLAVAVTIGGYILWYWALGQGGIARIGLFQFLQPVSGVALAALFLGEPMSARMLVSAALILGGVYLASR